MKRLFYLTPIVGFGYLLAVACNDASLTKGAVSSPSPIWSAASPSPTPSPVPTAICPDNADWTAPYPNDPDDGPGNGDAITCVWYCAVDPNIGVWAPNAREIVEVWDFDPFPTGYMTQYPAPPGFPFATTPNTTDCNAWIP